MHYRILDLTVFIALAALGAMIIYQSYELPAGFGGDMGSGYFPRILGWMLIGFCVLGAVSSLFSKAVHEFSIPMAWQVAGTVVLMALFIWSWSTFGYFYLQLAVFLFVLLTFYRASVGINAKSLGLNALFAVIVSVAFYVVFNHFMYVNV
ncbi:tripartite tricarboxylate transporter TctB family protein [Marinobacter sp. X15-166B]|uniref:tripartite tricarboxylate transporter TctB family protein n=1 Tax=Marinobacter sp. X15-166B TaxID=1897620 RepID=UPI00085BF1EA|nr:tripartite tricarboxylate transporter TctB family protein [Marinobacter sp. X15-166B]OEY66109.1 hypothetical protein BG841_06315 [Marinobacter sp. X15-166B]